MSASIGSDGQAMARPWSCRGRGRCSPRRAAGLIGVAVGLATALPACTPAQPPSSAAAGGAARPARDVLRVAGQANAQADNTAFPDAAEAYFWQPIVASAGTRIVCRGASRTPATPRSRSTRLAVSARPARLPDRPAARQPESLAAARRPGGRLTVTSPRIPRRARSDPAAACRHHEPAHGLPRLPCLPAGRGCSLGCAASGADDGARGRGAHASRLPQPQRPRALPGGKRFRRLCRGRGRIGAAAPPPPQLEFFKPPQSTFNNGGTRQRRHQLRPGLPGPPPGSPTWSSSRPRRRPSRPAAIPRPGRPGEDVRYWSMCIGLLAQPTPVVANKLPGGGTDYGCRADEATRLNAAGDYTYAIGSESQRAAISRVPGVTFLPFSTTQASRLYLAWACGTCWSARRSRTRPRASRRPATRRRPRPSWAPTTRARRSARWRPSPPTARRHACGEQGRGHALHYFYKR